MSRGSSRQTECRSVVTVLGVPVDTRLRFSRSTEVVELTRKGGRVISSARRPAPVVPALGEAAGRALRHGVERLATVSGPDAVVQNLLTSATARWSPGTRPVPVVRSLARVATRTGPLVLGGRGEHALDEVVHTLTELAGLRPGPVEPGTWRHEVLLRPAVTAVFVVAARMVLGSPAAGRLHGRRLPPPLTLVDEPVEHATGDRDDSGSPVGPLELLTAGRVRVPASGTVTGRAAWVHDHQRTRLATPFRLRLTGAPAPASREERIELLYPVEGRQRYRADGQVRITCLARLGERSFPVRLCARPLSLLGRAAGVCGPPTELYSDHETVVPALVLPAREHLEEADGVTIDSA